MQVIVGATDVPMAQDAEQGAPGWQNQPISFSRPKQGFDVVRVKYITFDIIKSVLFIKLESSTSQKHTKLTYKIDSGADGNLMPVNILKSLFPKATTELLCATKTTQSY